MLERGEGDLRKLGGGVDHDVVEVAPQGGDHPAHVEQSDPIGISGMARGRQYPKSAVVDGQVLLDIGVEIRPLLVAPKDDVDHGVARVEPQSRHDLAELEVEIHQADPPAGGAVEKVGQIGRIEGLPAPAARRGHADHLGKGDVPLGGPIGGGGVGAAGVERASQAGGQAAAVRRQLDQVDGADPDDVGHRRALGLGQDEQDRKVGVGRPDAAQPLHARPGVEQRAGH